MAEEGSGSKAFGGIVAVIALVSAVAAIFVPMNNRMAAVEDTLKNHVTQYDHPVRLHEQIGANKYATEKALAIITSRMLKNDDRAEHRVASLVKFEESMREVETQFLHMDRLIQLLWNRVYAEPLPNPLPRRE